ncbi:hypothetical protein QJQ45_002394 [Haematococcus lacustris]|nr:hypothetical protein QJQ45_002394 [Haematococcus lacustris]
MQQVVSRSTYEAVANDKDDTSSTAAPGAKPPTRLWLMLQLVGTCSVFLCCSSGIIVVNRVIMRELGFGYPMALSAWGQGVSFLVAWVVCDGVKLAPAPVGMEWRYILTVIVPMGAAQGVAIWLSNKLYTLLTEVALTANKITAMYSGPFPFSALDFPELTAFTNVAGPGSCLVYNGSGHLALQPHGSGSMTVQSNEADSDSDSEEVGSRQAAADMETTFGENEEEEEGSELGSEPVQLYAIPPKGRRAALVPASDSSSMSTYAKGLAIVYAHYWDKQPSDEDFLERLAIVAFIEMARAMLPLITLAALWLASLETPTLEHIKAVSLTGVGCAISAYGEVALSTLGLICVALNFAIEAGRMVMMQFLVQGRDIHPWQTLKLMTLPATLMLLAMSAALELQDMRRQGAGRIIIEQWPFFAAAGTLGLAVNILANVIIKLSSATTVKLLGAVRGPMLVLTGVLLFAETVTPLQFVGYSLALAGFVWYNLAKARTGGGAKGSNPGKV